MITQMLRVCSDPFTSASRSQQSNWRVPTDYYHGWHGFNDIFRCGRGLCEYLKTRIRDYAGEVLTQQGMTLYHRYFVRPKLHSIAFSPAPTALDGKQRFGDSRPTETRT